MALNNFETRQNALALLHDDFATFEVLGHCNEPQTAELSESAVNRLPDGTWMAICRNEIGNYHFATSPNGWNWSVARELPFVTNGDNSKPTFHEHNDAVWVAVPQSDHGGSTDRVMFGNLEDL